MAKSACVCVPWSYTSRARVPCLNYPIAYELSIQAFVLNHSKEYTAALLVSWVEFWLEAFLFPAVKQQPMVIALGACLALLGHYFRVGAMWTAGSNFNHEIMQRVSVLSKRFQSLLSSLNNTF